MDVARVRSRALLGLPAGTGLLERCRLAFLGLNTVNAAATIVAMAAGGPSGVMLGVPILAVCCLVAAHWWTAHRERTSALDELTVGVCMLTASLALPDVTMTVTLVFSAVMFRCLYGTHVVAALRTVGYIAVYAAALYLADFTGRLTAEAGARSMLLLPLPAIVTSALTMRLLFVAVRSRDAAAAELDWQAGHDGLTGLANRKRFMAALTECSSQAGAGALAVLFVDLDGFKAVNDRHGHRAGDELLAVLAERLRATVRDAGTVARLGGDEFAVLLPHLDHPGAADALAERLEAALTAPVALGCGTTVAVGASVGVHVTSRPYDADQVLHAADSAMYTIKAGHRAVAR